MAYRRDSFGTLGLRKARQFNVWVGRFYVEIPQSDGSMLRKQRRVSLGTDKELSRDQALEKLARERDRIRYEYECAKSGWRPELVQMPDAVGWATLHPHLKGTWGEYMCAADLTLRGYEVFKPIGMNNTCDLVALRNGPNPTCLRIEVKVGVWTDAKQISYRVKHDHCDLYGIVEPQSGRVKYFQSAKPARSLVVANDFQNSPQVIEKMVGPAELESATSTVSR